MKEYVMTNQPDSERAVETRRQQIYQAPEVVRIGAATKLIRGPMFSGPYRDCSNDGRTNWPVEC